MDTTIGKPFIDVEKQINKLENRGLIIESKMKAKQFLLKTTYYDVVNGYKDIFLEPKQDEHEEDKFLENTNFNDLLTLYNFDKRIRHIILNAVLDVECNFYSALAYSISEKYSEKQEDYLKRENYKPGKKQSYNNKTERDNLLSRINKKINDPEDQPLKYYKNKYHNIPPWILVKALTFGELIVLYKLSSSDIKNNVINILLGIEANDKVKEFFIKSLELFNKFRNRAAHGGRIYNYRTNIELPYKEDLFKVLRITKENYNKGQGKNDIAAFTLALYNFHQNDISRTYGYLAYFDFDYKKYKEEQPAQSQKVLESIGLPFDYYDRLIRFKIYVQ